MPGRVARVPRAVFEAFVRQVLGREDITNQSPSAEEIAPYIRNRGLRSKILTEGWQQSYDEAADEYVFEELTE